MNKFFQSFSALFIASLKMYYRNKTAVFFSFIMPFVFLAVFGFLSKSTGGNITVAVSNQSQHTMGTQIVDTLKEIKNLKVLEVSPEEARKKLDNDKAELTVLIPENFEVLPGQTQPVVIKTEYNQAKPANGQIANLIVQQVVQGFNNRLITQTQPLQVESTGVQTKNLGPFDFYLPGILALTIMQIGIFGVAFAFVSLKASGALRRIQASPTHPRSFVLAQALTRLTIVIITVLVLVFAGKAFFDFHMNGSYVTFLALALLGALVFIGFGFIIAGYAKDENQAAPLANLIQLPMLFLSGIFFSRDNLPEWLQKITVYFPLTYLSEGLRQIANQGLSVTQLGSEFIGLLVWCVIVFTAAVWVFRWE